MAPSGDAPVAIRSDGKLTKFALFQTVAMRSVKFSEPLDHLGLLKYAMFREGHADGKFAVAAGGDVTVPGGQCDVGMDGIVDGRTDEKLLPLCDNVMPAPLSFEMKAPFGIADRVIAKIIPPAVSVVGVYAGLSEERRYGTEKEENFHGVVFDDDVFGGTGRAACPQYRW